MGCCNSGQPPSRGHSQRQTGTVPLKDVVVPANARLAGIKFVQSSTGTPLLEVSVGGVTKWAQLIDTKP